MSRFNANDPKYISCCCGAHVAKLAQVFIILTLVSHFIEIFKLSPLALIGLLIACFGTLAVFQQMRTAIRVFIVLEVIYILLYVACQMIIMAETPTAKADSNLMGQTIFTIFLAIACNFPFLITYYNLSEFIADREAAERLPVQFQVLVKPVATPAAPAARPVPLLRSTAVPSAPLAEVSHGASSGDAPPPYEEKA